MVVDYSRASSPIGFRSFRSSLELIGNHHTLRCDAKLADQRFRDWNDRVRQEPFRELGEFLPDPFVKGVQLKYLDERTNDSIPVVNTLSIQSLALNLNACRHVKRPIFHGIHDSKKLKLGDVLLTMDGGVSIGKPYLFSIDEDMTVDTHIVVLRPDGISPLSLTYLLASPVCQKQFRQAESGASGQTAVTEDDVRRFIVPSRVLERVDDIAREIHHMRQQIREKRRDLDKQEQTLFARLSV